jgi:hypothetical protein
MIEANPLPKAQVSLANGRECSRTSRRRGQVVEVRQLVRRCADLHAAVAAFRRKQMFLAVALLK